MPTHIALSGVALSGVAGHDASAACPAAIGQRLAASPRDRGSGVALCILIAGGAVLSVAIALRVPAAGDAIEALATVAGF